MSVRESRKKSGQVIAERLRAIRQKRQDCENEETALLVAQSAIAEEPRGLLQTRMLVEYVPISAWQAEIAHCSECKAKITGWSDAFKFCPVCGSAVAQVQRESSQQEAHDRITRNAVANALTAFA